VIALMMWLGSCAVAAEPAVRPTFYVAVNGNDENAGTEKKPFATIGRAKEAVRQRVAAGLNEDIAVVIRTGRYELREPLVFGPEDSGTAEHSVTYVARDAQDMGFIWGGREFAGPLPVVVISGGRRITGWKKGDGGLWTAQVPGVKEGQWYPRQLFVDGRRAIRARTPNADADPPGLRLVGAELSGDSKVYRLMLAPGQVKAWRNLSDVEVNFCGEWETMRKRVESVDEAQGVVTLIGPHVPMTNHPWNRPAPGKSCTLENAFEFLDQPGEWYLDRQTGVLTYWPLEGQDLTKVEAIAPALTGLVEVKGTAERPVRNLHFRGLRFEHVDWPLPEGGYQGTQACHFTHATADGFAWALIDAALHYEFAESCSVTDGDIAHLGGCGIFLDNGCHSNTIEGNRILDIGGNGVEVSAPDNQTPAPRGNRVANNQVHTCGVDYQGSVGIWDGMTEGTVIAHNLVHDLPYTGISVGWQWNPEPTNCQGNLIEYNHIHDCMKTLSDGGGIYTLGFQPGTVIRGNVIHDIRRSSIFSVGAPNNGMFVDEGSKGFLIEGNVIYATSGAPVRHNQNQPDWHTWKDNRFGIAVPAPGRIGSGLYCDGSSTFYEPPDSAGIDPKRLTVAAWVKLSEYPSGPDTRRWIVNKNDDEWIESHWGLVVDSGNVGAYLNIGGTQADSHEVWSTSKPLTLNAWHTLAMTYDGAELTVYCDGKPVASTSIGRERAPGNTPIAIGRRQDAYNYFGGIIDEVRVYDRALSEHEIRAQFATPKKPDLAAERGLVGYWGFDDLGTDEQALKEAMEKAGPEAKCRERWKAEEDEGDLVRASAAVEF